MRVGTGSFFRLAVCMVLVSWAPLIETESLAFTYTPTTLTFSATTNGGTPPAQSITFSRKSFLLKEWTATPNSSWMTVTPTTGNISSDRDTMTVQVNAAGLPAGSYSSSVRIEMLDRYRRVRAETVPVTMVVINETTASLPGTAASPEPMSVAGMAEMAPLTNELSQSNSISGTLTWLLAKLVPWMEFNITTGMARAEPDQTHAGVNVKGPAAGIQSSAINIASFKASKPPQKISLIRSGSSRLPTS